MQKRKIISLFLVFCLLLALMPGSLRASATEAENPIQEQPQTDLTLESAPIEEEPTESLAQSSQILKYVDANVFASHNHVARIPEEESLNTYVFRNEDGSKTVYYLAENVKYISGDGAVLEKDLTLLQNAEGFGIVRSDIGYTLPNDASGGIGLSHGQKSVVLIPQNPNAKAGKGHIDGDSVRYPNYFGQGIHLVYTPIPSGLKEDIVLDSYTGVNSFTFLLCTNGLNLYQADGRYYLAQAADAADKLYLGEVIVYDAKGEPSPGTMTAVTVKEGQQYRLTVTADPAFLTDPDTRYPVTIDPTLTVSDNTHGAGAIEDASIYASKPTLNAGTWTYNHSGYYNSTYGKCRTVYRLASLLTDSGYQSAAAANITSAKFYVKEATGSAGVTVNLHAMSNTTWEEKGITWNNAGSYSSTVYASASPSYNNWANWDITSLVKAWKNGGQNPNAGFILVSTNETSIDKAFYSSEYGTTSNRPYVVVSYTENTSGLNYTSKDVDEGSTFQLTWSGVSSGITWTSSNTSVATVNSSGKVTGVKAGTATITASASGYASVHCTVYVTVTDGIYYIKNNLSGYYLGIPSSAVSSGNMAKQQTKVTSDPARFAQLWRVHYITAGYYSIRPVHKPDSALNLTATFVDIWETGTTDSLAAVSASRRWTITYSQGGYVFKNSTNGSAMAPTSLSTAVNTTITVGTLTTSAAYRWSFETPAAISSQMLLYDNNTKTYNSNIVRYIAPGETLTLSQLGLHATFVSSGTMTQVLVWTSGNSSCVSVNAATGTITGVNPGGSTTITVSQRSGGIIYSKSYTIHVTLLQEGTYFIRNKASNKYVDIQRRTMADGTPLLQWDFHGEASEKWTFQHLGNGAYSIRSENASSNFYMGVQNHSSALNRPVLLRTGSVSSTPALQWKVSTTSSGAYKLIPMDTSSYALTMYAASGSSITDNDNLLRLETYGADTDYTDEWEICYANVLNLNVVYDAAYVDRFGGSSAARAEVSAQLETLQEVFQDLFSIQVTYNTPYQYATYANLNCTTSATGTCNHGTCANSTLSSLEDYHHTNIHNILYRLSTPSSPISATVLYIGHDTCLNNGTECITNPNDGRAISALGIVSNNCNRSRLNCTQVLIHEIGHLFGAKDHYGGSAPTTDEINGGNDGPYSRFCMYGEDSFLQTIKENNTICEGCQADIEENASKYFISQ